jgi:predicted nuclease of predicted toxin-antitoxin system
MPRAVAPELRSIGIDAVDVREVGLRIRSDHEIFEFARAHQRVILTEDMDFSNELTFPSHLHAGIFIFRIPNKLSIQATIEVVVDALAQLSDDPLVGTLVVVRPGHLRVRRTGRR